MQTLPTHVTLVVSAPGQIKVERALTKRTGSGEIMVSPLRVGVCGTDLEIIRRTRPDVATILGHEGVAEVVEIGPGVAEFSVGQLVIFNPVNPNDQNDILGHSTEGLFQQRFLVSQSALKRGLVVPFDARVPLVCGPLVEPLGTVIYGQSLVEQVCHQECIAVIGAGPIGLLNAFYARSQGCASVFLVDNSRERLDWAVRRNIVSADEAVLNSTRLADVLLERTAGHGVDAVYLCTTRTSAPEALSQSLRYLRRGGCIDLVVGFSDGDSIPELPNVELNGIRRANFCGRPHAGKLTRCFAGEGKAVWLTGHRGTSEDHLQDAMKSLLKEPDRYASIISHVVSLSAAPLVLERLLTTRPKRVEGEECVKVIIDVTREAQVIEVFEPRSVFLKAPGDNEEHVTLA